MKTSPPTDPEPGILLIAPDESIRDAARVLQLDDGFQIFAAADRQEALERIRCSPIQLVIMGTSMPGPEGLGMVISILGAVPSMRILAVSSGQPDGWLGLARSLGASTLLGNPISPESLVSAAREYLAPRSHPVAC